jgi:hypothetical protein
MQDGLDFAHRVERFSAAAAQDGLGARLALG